VDVRGRALEHMVVGTRVHALEYMDIRWKTWPCVGAHGHTMLWNAYTYVGTHGHALEHMDVLCVLTRFGTRGRAMDVSSSHPPILVLFSFSRSLVLSDSCLLVIPISLLHFRPRRVLSDSRNTWTHGHMDRR
jgi:hypothetical protein